MRGEPRRAEVEQCIASEQTERRCQVLSAAWASRELLGLRQASQGGQLIARIGLELLLTWKGTGDACNLEHPTAPTAGGEQGTACHSRWEDSVHGRSVAAVLAPVDLNA
jgi:hypothetical protein